MKYHKIKNIPLQVCTAEAKIAYNVALSYASNYRETWIKNKDKYSGWAKSEFIHDVIKYCMHFVLSNEIICKKYNTDAIQCCLHAGMENYFNHKYRILCTYEDIGDIFKSLYL